MRNAVQSDIVRAAERIVRAVGDMGEATCGYLVGPVRLTAEIVEAAYRGLGSGGQTIDTFIEARGGDAALRDAVRAVLSGARIMAMDPTRMDAMMLGAATPLIPGLMMRWNEIHLAGEFLFYISAEKPGTSRSWRHSNWRERLIERLRERRIDQRTAMHQEMRDALLLKERMDELSDHQIEEYHDAYRDLATRRQTLDRRIEVPYAEAFRSASEEGEKGAMPQWIGIDLGDCRFEHGRLGVRAAAPWHAPYKVIDRIAEAVEGMLDIASEPGGRLDAQISIRRRQIAETLHDAPQTTLLDVKVRTLSQDKTGNWTGKVNVVSDIKGLDLFGISTVIRIEDHGYDSSNKGMPKSLDGLIRHQRRITAIMDRKHRHSPFTVEAVLARAMAGIDRTGLAAALHVPAATAGKKARVLGLPPEFRTIGASNGRLSGRIALSPTISYRDGTVRARGVSLPQAALASLAGKPVSTLLESPLLGHAIITDVRSTTDGILVTIEAGPDVPFDDIVDGGAHDHGPMSEI